MPVYTKPEKSWSVDEMANAALLNQYQRDNMAATLHRIAYKTADETVTNSTTLQNDNHLVIDLAANTNWYLRVVLMCRQPSPVTFNSDIKVAFTFTSGTTALSCWTYDAAGALVRREWTSSGTSQTMDADSSTGTVPVVHVIEGIQTVVAASTFTVQWAQFTADTGGLTVYTGSAIWGANVT